MDDGAPVSEDSDPEPPRRRGKKSARPVPPPLLADPWIDWPVERFDSKGNPLGPSRVHVENTQALLAAYRIEARYNLMTHSAELTLPDMRVAQERRENVSFAHVINLAERRGLAEKQTLKHIHVLAAEYHPARDWILSRPAETPGALDRFWRTVRLASDADEPFSRLLFDRWMAGCIAAVMPEFEEHFTPQGVLTLQGAQNVGKTSWLASMQPHGKKWIGIGLHLDAKDRDSVQQVTSFWITELGELGSTFNKSDQNALKAFVTRSTDVYRSAYALREERVPRRTMLAGTVNDPVFLVDPTGNRRWWTIPVVGFERNHGLDMQQVWAEVYERVKAGLVWYLNDDEVRRLGELNRRFESQDPLLQDLWATWMPDPFKRARMTLAGIYAELPGRQFKARSGAESRTMAAALRQAGLENDTETHGAATFCVAKRGLVSWSGGSSERGGAYANGGV